MNKHHLTPNPKSIVSSKWLGLVFFVVVVVGLGFGLVVGLVLVHLALPVLLSFLVGVLSRSILVLVSLFYCYDYLYYS